METRVTSEFTFLKKHLDEVMNKTKIFPAKTFRVDGKRVK